MLKFNYKDIYCPECKTKVMQYDGITKTPQVVVCYGCHCHITYYPETDSVTRKHTVERKTSSGKRF